MTKTTIYLPDDLKKQIEETAERERKSEAEVIREAITAAMRDRTPPAPTVPLFENGFDDPTIAERVDELFEDDFDR